MDSNRCRDQLDPRSRAGPFETTRTRPTNKEGEASPAHAHAHAHAHARTHTRVFEFFSYLGTKVGARRNRVPERCFPFVPERGSSSATLWCPPHSRLLATFVYVRSIDRSFPPGIFPSQRTSLFSSACKKDWNRVSRV